MIALSARAVLRARNGAGNRIAPRGGEFPFSLPAGRMLAGCPRVTIFPALRELVSRATLSVATGAGVASVPIHMYKGQGRRFLCTFCHCGLRGISFCL